MSHTITVLPSGKQFRGMAEEPILFSAIAAHVSVPYGCRGGVCGVCRAKVPAPPAGEVLPRLGPIACAYPSSTP